MQYISIGKILNFHGIQGEAKVGFSKDQQDFLKTLKFVYIKKDIDYIKFDISNVRFNKTFALIKFKGINSINELMPYKGCIIFTEEDFVRKSLSEEEFLVDELIGLEVLDLNNKKIGTIVSVLNNKSQDLLSVKSLNNKICSVPFVKELVPTIDLKNKKIIVNNIEGLIE